MHTKPRYGASIDKIVVHDPEGANTAPELLNYLAGISGGYHALSDDFQLLVAAADDLIVEGAGGMNTHALHICFVPGRAAWSRDEWLVHRAAIERGGQWMAEKAKQYGIPARWLSPAEVATDGVKGFCTHGDVTAAGFTASEGHTDPGAGFPKDVLLAAALKVLNPITAADRARLIAIDEWRHRVHAHALHYGDQSHDVAILINALRRKHFLRWWVRGDKYGPALRTGIVKFKNSLGGAFAAQPAPERGETFGGDAADALVALG